MADLDTHDPGRATKNKRSWTSYMQRLAELKPYQLILNRQIPTLGKQTPTDWLMERMLRSSFEPRQALALHKIFEPPFSRREKGAVFYLLGSALDRPDDLQLPSSGTYTTDLQNAWKTISSEIDEFLADLKPEEKLKRKNLEAWKVYGEKAREVPPTQPEQHNRILHLIYSTLFEAFKEQAEKQLADEREKALAIDPKDPPLSLQAQQLKAAQSFCDLQQQYYQAELDEAKAWEELQAIPFLSLILNSDLRQRYQELGAEEPTIPFEKAVQDTAIFFERLEEAQQRQATWRQRAENALTVFRQVSKDLREATNSDEHLPTIPELQSIIAQRQPAQSGPNSPAASPEATVEPSQMAQVGLSSESADGNPHVPPNAPPNPRLTIYEAPEAPEEPPVLAATSDIFSHPKSSIKLAEPPIPAPTPAPPEGALLPPPVAASPRCLAPRPYNPGPPLPTPIPIPSGPTPAMPKPAALPIPSPSIPPPPGIIATSFQGVPPLPSTMTNQPTAPTEENPIAEFSQAILARATAVFDQMVSNKAFIMMGAHKGATQICSFEDPYSKDHPKNFATIAGVPPGFNDKLTPVEAWGKFNATPLAEQIAKKFGNISHRAVQYHRLDALAKEGILEAEKGQHALVAYQTGSDLKTLQQACYTRDPSRTTVLAALSHAINYWETLSIELKREYEKEIADKRMKCGNKIPYLKLSGAIKEPDTKQDPATIFNEFIKYVKNNKVQPTDALLSPTPSAPLQALAPTEATHPQGPQAVPQNI